MPVLTHTSMQPGQDEILARTLREQLKPVRGPTPQLGHVRAALLLAKHDTLSSREACRRVEISADAHTRVAALADRVRALLLADELDPVTAQPPPPPPGTHQHDEQQGSVPGSVEQLAEALSSAQLSEADQPWPHEEPPRLREDFGGEARRNAYERARAEWFLDFRGSELPPFDPQARGADRHAQIAARAELWSKAVRSYKDRARDRVYPADDDERRRIAHQCKLQQRWVDDAVAVGLHVHALLDEVEHMDAPPPPAIPPSLPWPACDWRSDLNSLLELCEFMEAHPPTGEKGWSDAVEAAAVDVYGLEAGIDFWDDTAAPGYRLLLMLPDAPTSLCGLPLNDRFWIRQMNSPFTCELQAPTSSLLSRMYQLAYTQYLGQRSHPEGLQSANKYIAAVGFSPFLPIDETLRCAVPTHLLLGYGHPAFGGSLNGQHEQPRLSSLDRPCTLNADISHEISPAQRESIEHTVQLAAKGKGPVHMQRKVEYRAHVGTFLIPFGDLYYFDAVGTAVENVMAGGCDTCQIDLNGVLMEAAAIAPSVPRDLSRHFHKCVRCE